MKTNFFKKDRFPLSKMDKSKVRKLTLFISSKLYFQEMVTDKVNSRTNIRIPSTDNITTIKKGNKKYYYYFTNIFYGVIAENILLNAATKNPELFGTNNSEDIIRALNLEKPGFCSDDSIYKEEQYCYVIEEDKNGELNEKKILKIQLFRFQELEDKKKPLSNKVFTGGLFHAFKHFTFKGTNLSIKIKPEHDLDYNPSYFISDITNAFFNNELVWAKDENNKNSLLGKFNSINFYFYCNKELNLGVHFLTTAHYNKGSSSNFMEVLQ